VNGSPPSDVTLGEVYRLAQTIDRRVTDLDRRLESKTVTLDVYTLAQNQLIGRIADVEKDVHDHELTHDATASQRASERRAMITAVAAALLASLGSFCTSLAILAIK
jgi:hypothetical protein